MGTFHSAVNRIPMKRDLAISLTEATTKMRDIFGDHAAPGHDRLANDGWSGTIDLEMTVRTPLVFGDQYKEDAKGRRVEESDGLKKNPGSRNVIEVPMDGSGRPFVSPTMVKGMISRAYETLTASRFRVFGEHRDPLTYRVDPSQANQLFPARVCRDEADDLAVEILNGRDQKDKIALLVDSLNIKGIEVVREGHMKFSPGWSVLEGDNLPSEEQVLERFRSLTPHGALVQVRLTRNKDDQLVVTHIRHNDTKKFEEFFQVQLEDGQKGSISIKPVKGYVCRTAPDDKSAADLFNGKKYEKLFFKVDPSWKSIRPTILLLNQEKIQKYKLIIESYRKEHIRHKGQHLLNRASQVSGEQNIEELPIPNLADNDLVFVRTETVPNTDGKTLDGIPVHEVLPTMVGRRAYQVSPQILAEEQQVVPPKNRDEASPADRLFGYVIPETTENARGGDVAYRGRVSFGPVDLSGAKLSDKKKELVPLLEPKVSSARRFLTDAKGATPKGNGHYFPRRDYFTSSQLLGTAAYPVHCDPSLDADDFPTMATELPNTDLNQNNKDVRITAKTWVKTGSVLKCTLHFENLSKLELAALVWVLIPENLVPLEARNQTKNAIGEACKGNGEESAKPVGFLRMGLGKPLGLGAVEVRIAEDGLRAWRGGRLAKEYESLEACLGAQVKTRKLSKFSLKKLIRKIDPDHQVDLDRLPWVQAMQRAAYGYDDGVEVRYMSLDENKANNQTDNKGNPKRARLEDGSYEDRGVSPTDLFSPGPDFETYRPAPISISVTKENDQKNRNGQEGNKRDTNSSREGRNNNSTHNGSKASRGRRKQGQTR